MFTIKVQKSSIAPYQTTYVTIKAQPPSTHFVRSMGLGVTPSIYRDPKLMWGPVYTGSDPTQLGHLVELTFPFRPEKEGTFHIYGAAYYCKDLRCTDRINEGAPPVFVYVRIPRVSAIPI
jgi:hypothetical protein